MSGNTTPAPRRPIRRRVWLACAGTAAVGGVVAVFGLSADGPASATKLGPALATAASTQELVSTPQASPAPGAASTPVEAALASLVVAADSAAQAYDRTAFGAAWTDTDRNGCDTRNDVLRRDLTAVVLKPGTHGCVVLSGSLLDPYSGRTLPFRRGHPGIQVDHVVALAAAWRSGASTWPYPKLLAYANDPLELLAVDGSLNEAKGDGDADAWLPPLHVCAYAARQVAVKAKYQLTVTAPEHDALLTTLAACPGQPLPAGGTPTLAPNRSPAPSAAATPAGVQGFVATSATDPDYGTCRNAKAHGAGPYYAGKDSEYEWYQDRDHDGIVCE